MSQEKQDEVEKPEIDDSGNPPGNWAAYVRIFSYADGLSCALYVLALLALLAAGTALPLLDLVFGKFVNTFNQYTTSGLSNDEFQSRVMNISLLLVYIFIGKFVLFYSATMALSVASMRTTKALRLDFIEKTLRQEIAFFDGSDIGAVAMQVTNSGNLVQQGIAEKLGVIIQAISTFVTSFIVALVTQWKLSLITMAVVPGIIFGTGVPVFIDTIQESKILRFYNTAGDLATEFISSIRMVQAFWGQPKVIRKYGAVLDEAQKEGMKKSPTFAFLFSAEYFCVYSGYALAFWQGTRMYASGEITDPGDIIVVVFAVLAAATSITLVAPQVTIISKSASAAASLLKIIDRPSSLDPFAKSGQKLCSLNGDVRFCDVRFAYPTRPDVSVLNGVSMHFPANKTTAVVGASGSGKSTIVGLLERWYECGSGHIELDGIDIKNLDVQWLRTAIRLVQQEPVLFNVSIFENVLNGLPDAEQLSEQERMSRVKKACESAYADEFISRLPQGYHTVVGERASMLSGGQKQRIAIARSIVSDPRILLLDEATSALDPEAEKQVQKALDSVKKSRTTVMIAHKLSTIKEADNIVVVEKGMVMEQGTHSQLIALQGAYHRLVMAQDLGDEASSPTSRKDLAPERTLTNQDKVCTSIDEEDELKEQDKKQTLEMGMLKCVFVFLGEQSKTWPYWVIIGIACVLGGLSYPALAILITRLIITFQGAQSELVERGDFYSLMVFIVATANFMVYFVMGWFTNVLSQKLNRSYREDMFKAMIYQDMDFFDKKENTTGALVSRLSTAPSQLQELLSFNATILCIALVNLISTCVLAFVVGWKLALVVVFGGLFPIVASAYARFLVDVKLEAETERRMSTAAAVASEAVAAIRTVSSLALEQRVIDKCRENMDGLVGGFVKLSVWINLFFSFAQSVEFAAVALTFWYGSRLVAAGEYSTTQFFIVFIAVLLSAEACVQLSTFMSSMSKGREGANYILWLRKQQPKMRELDSDQLGPSEKRDEASFQMQNLEFAYKSRPRAPVIAGVDIDIQPGEKVAFVGASGSGKSTIVALLERFYDPTSGHIRFSGQDISALCPRRYRRRLAYVQQEPTLLSGTIRENVAFALDEPLPSVSGSNADNIAAANSEINAAVENACRQANIWTFVTSLPEGLSTPCGRSGGSLSGGQRQRIAIARALVRRPEVLLLDEATSALDTESERQVQAAVEKAADGRTTVSIAHRLSTIKEVDRIYVFRGGRVIEVGQHKELLEKKGMYWKMCLAQSVA